MGLRRGCLEARKSVIDGPKLAHERGEGEVDLGLRRLGNLRLLESFGRVLRDPLLGHDVEVVDEGLCDDFPWPHDAKTPLLKVSGGLGSLVGMALVGEEGGVGGVRWYGDDNRGRHEVRGAEGCWWLRHWGWCWGEGGWGHEGLGWVAIRRVGVCRPGLVLSRAPRVVAIVAVTLLTLRMALFSVVGLVAGLWAWLAGGIALGVVHSSE